MITKGACKEHGMVKNGVPDIRIKAVIDNGATATNVLLNREMTEQITVMTLDECIDMASDALDAEVIIKSYKEKLIGRYFEITGPAFNSLLVKEITPINRTEKETEELIEELKEMV